MLDRLEKAGCIKREPNPGDRRSVLVRVNPRKMEKINAHYAGVAAQLDEYISGIPEAELTSLVGFFKQMNAMRVKAAIGLK